MTFHGRVWRFGDNVDTDLIIPARFLNVSDEEELARHCFEDVRPDFAKDAAAGDIVIGGNNFGCGSSREHAPLAIKAKGICVVVARSFARIFYRNAFNIGLPLLELEEGLEWFLDGETVSVDIATGKIGDPSGKPLLLCQTDSGIHETDCSGRRSRRIHSKTRSIKGGALKNGAVLSFVAINC